MRICVEFISFCLSTMHSSGSLRVKDYLTLRIYGWYAKRISWNIFFSPNRQAIHSKQWESILFCLSFLYAWGKKGKVTATGSSWAAADMFFVPHAGCHSHPEVSVFPSTSHTSRVNCSCSFSLHVWFSMELFSCTWHNALTVAFILFFCFFKLLTRFILWQSDHVQK